MNYKHLVVALVGLVSASGAALASDDERKVFDAYQEIFRPERPGGRPTLSSRERRALYQATVENPVAALDPARVAQYDPQGIIGFCFGRAMTAQLGARKLGLALPSLRKLFIVGALCAGCTKPEDAPEWRFHVTMLVRGAGGQWYAIDPIMYESGAYVPLTMERWIERVRAGWDRYHGGAPRAKLYLAPPDAVMPDLTSLPSPETGTHLIELNFVPEEHGLRADTSLVRGEKIYVLDDSASDRYFLTTSEPAGDRFQFLDISINGDRISYNGYFADLLKTNLNPRRYLTPASENARRPARRLLPLGMSLERLR